MTDPPAADRLWAEFERLCDCGGRLSGTASEAAAMDLLVELGESAMGAPVRRLPVPYLGWRPLKAELRLVGEGGGEGGGEAVACRPLVRSIATPPGGLRAEVIDLGRGTPEEFAAHAAEIPGRIVLVRHERMFAAGTIHRRRKYAAALEAGAAGFLVAGPVEGALVAGSSGRAGGAGIPAMGIAPETARRLARRAAGRPVVEMVLESEEGPAETHTLLFDLPGRSDEWVVLSAHIDGHDLAESAMDNATGLAAALAAARAMAPAVAGCRRGLRLAFFSVEEWALTGSEVYVAGLSEAERQAIALNVNLDSVAGGARLTALTSGFAGLEPFLLRTAEAAGVELGLFRPLQMNSDHGNFASAGIPAFRLVAGFDDPAAATTLVLTPLDTRERVPPAELTRAAALTEAIVRAALDAAPAEAARWREPQAAGA